MSDSLAEKQLFLAALEVPPEHRDAFLRGACTDEAVRARVETLLRHHISETAEASVAGTTPNSPPPDEEEPPVASMLDEFRILRVLGEGGMGIVYLAEDTVLGRKVAIKVLARHLTGSEQALGRFRDEARSAALLSHPAIVPVYKFGLSGGSHYIASEYVEGETLAKLIDGETARRRTDSKVQGIQDWNRRSAEIIATVADALECSHRAGIVHRDVKPSNVLVDPQRGPRLTDFGIAKHLSGGAATASADIIGSCHYMSPEQASIAERTVDHRSDVFSLGVMLYEMAALRRPFDGRDVQQVLKAVIESEPPRLRAVNPLIPKDLETICLKAMEKSRDRRYQSAAHVSADLRAFLAGRPILANPPGLRRRATHWISRRRFGLAVTASAVSLAALGGMARWMQHSRAERQQWVRIETEMTGLTAYLRRADLESLEFGPSEELGGVPLATRLEPGQYRITLVAPHSGDYAEVNLVATNPGHAGEIRVAVHADAARGSVPDAESSRERHAFLKAWDQAALSDMSFVEPGEYAIGWSDREAPLVRRRRVRLPAFWIDKFEVSNDEYRKFLESTGYPAPDGWGAVLADGNLLDRPVTSVRFEDAEAYARWRGKRLPTALEWQAASRGAEGRDYPWPGALADGPGLAPVADDDIKASQSWSIVDRFERYRVGTVAVRGPDAAITPTGLAQTFGNVRELTGSVDPSLREVYLLGRCWADEPSTETLGHARAYPMKKYSFQIGFRCARSAAAPS